MAETELIDGHAASEKRLKESLRREFGPQLIEALTNPKIIDLMLNPDGRVWYEEFGKGRYDTGIKLTPTAAMMIFRTIATLHNDVVTPEKPILEAELPLDGSRFAGIIPPLVVAPSFTIRKPPPKVFTLEEYRQDGILTSKDDPLNRKTHSIDDFEKICAGKSHYDIIHEAVMRRKNIIIIGGTGSGKTNLVNAVIDHAAKHTNDRMILLEDTREIKCNAQNSVIMRASIHADMMRLLRVTLRFSPDRIIVGEVRGGEFLALLTAWLTGHEGGIATLHANDVQDAFLRMEQMMLQAGVPSDPRIITAAVDIIVDIGRETRVAAGRKVRSIAYISGYDSVKKQYVFHYL